MNIPEPIPVSGREARERIAELLAAVENGDGTRVHIERCGRPITAIVNAAELAILDAIEDRYVQLAVDRMAAAGVLDDGQRLTTEQVIARVSGPN